MKSRREALGLTQKDMADKLHIKVRSYQRYESGEREPRLEMAVRIAEILNTTVEAIWG